jgi:hypothetical protein
MREGLKKDECASTNTPACAGSERDRFEGKMAGDDKTQSIANFFMCRFDPREAVSADRN